ncbi:Chemotaxis protein methyltransferase CheR [Roseibacterium elongatum DSM 19469]|uniref:histidine kinase n=1 Tax=Roseicyclus elongatus DSM 19469 TaxID=1294273 RepID=W8S2M3_9RHOB|nr:PAS domain-containing protein [Roseibacterium elongatum]AHM02981.1 Chemotaxis protein methyltransferase CheR [Roseibacterium elongatum DSM 19469]
MDDTFPIVGIGASAGGLEALQLLVRAIPTDSGLAYVIVQHLAPEHPSIMDKLLGEHTAIPVTRIEDGEPVEPDHIYVIPPGPFLTIEGGRFRLEDHGRETGVRTPINRFFTSLAHECGRDAFAVVLSGTGSDGTLGVRAIKMAGGVAIVQESQSARFPGMPDSAAATGLVDLILPPDAMPARILDILDHRRGLIGASSGESMQDRIDQRLSDVLAALDPEAAHGFENYKTPTLVRRVLRRMSLLRMSGVDAYIDLLRNDAGEADTLRNDFLIGVTEFFRDPEVYAAVEREVVARLVAADEKGDTIRVWVPGCATGEEAYSLAMLLVEEMERTGLHRACQVFGTDIDMTALRHARSGIYSAAAVSHLSDERRKRFFHEDSGSFTILPALREMCIFAPHDILSDPPFSRLDMISCRNVMIYLTGDAQHGILPRFHYGLRPGGYLLLGPSESLGRNDGLFDTVDRNARLFQRNDRARPGYSVLSNGAARPPKPALERATPAEAWGVAAPGLNDASNLETQAEQAFLTHAAAPFAVIDAQGTMLYLSEGMTRYVRPTRGRPDMGVDSFLDRALRLPVQAALAEARDTGQAAEVHNVVIEIDGERLLFDVVATPMPDAGGATLVVLQEVRLRDSADIVPTEDRAADAEYVERKLDLANRQLAMMEREYSGTEQQLRSANEELLSMNEELQSSNEELETSREELQSINEELETINAELTENNRQLSRANSDMRNLLESTDIATLFLDPQRRVRLFTPKLTELYGIRERDIGRPIADLATRISYPELAEDSEQVMQTLQPVEREAEVAVTGQIFAVSVRPYRTIDDRIDGTVITFIDVTARRRGERQLEENARILREQFAELETLYDSIPVGLSLVDRDLRYLRINPSLAEINGFPPADHIGKRQEDLIPDIDQRVRDLQHQVLETGTPVRGLEVTGQTPSQPGVERTWLVDFYPVFDDGYIFAVGSCVIEVTEQRALELKAARAAAAVIESEARLKRLFDNVPVLISMHEGPDHVYVYSNPANDAMIGQLKPIGKPFAEVFGTETSKYILRALDEVFETGKPVTRDEVHSERLDEDGNPTGETVQFFHSAVPYFDDEQRVLGVMSFAYDITEHVEARKQVEDIAIRLTESEARMARLFDHAPAIISIFEGPEFRYSYVNPEHDRATGKAGDTLIGRPLREAMPKLAGQGIMERYEQVYETAKAQVTDELAAQVDGPGGRTTYYKQIIEPWYQGDGSVGGVMSFNYDITELVEARESVRTGERRLRTIQDSLRSFVGLLDTEGTLLEVNELALTRAGLHRDDVIGKPFWDCYWWGHDADLQARLRGWFDAALSGETIREECQVRMAEGVLITIDFNLMPSRDETGRVVEVIPSGIDVTDWRAAEERKDTLLGELQHRVKNSLATVQSIMRFSARTAATKEVLIESLQDRLAAISRTHDALTRSDWSGKSLHEIISEEVAPYADAVSERLRIDGPDVLLPPDMALSVGLAIHEMTTNAAKYGALSAASGTVFVTTEAENGRLTSLEWRERGGPPVNKPETKGFGSFLLERVLTNDLESTVDMQYAPDGLRCRIAFDHEREQ